MIDGALRRTTMAISASAPNCDGFALARAVALRVAGARGLPPPEDTDDALCALAAGLPALDYAALGGDLVGEVYESRLDAKARRRGGAHYTPRALADFLVGGAHRDGVLVDLACGPGRFLLAAARARGADPASQAVQALRGYEVDPHAARLAIEALALEAHGGDICRARTFFRTRVQVGDALRVDMPRARSVVGNPPYFATVGDAALQALGRERFAEVYSGRNDIAHYFVALALRMLEDGGRCALVLPSYLMENTFAARLRAVVARELTERTLYDFGALHIFEAQVHTLCLTGTKAAAPRVRHVVAKEGTTRAALLLDLANAARLHAAPRTLQTRDAEPALIAAMAEHPRLETLCAIEKGPETGCNEAFVLSTAEAARLGLEPALLRPLVKGRHVEAFRLLPQGEVMLYMDGRVDPALYPRALEHLQPFRARLEARADCRDGRYPWWRLHRPRSQALAAAQAKLVAPYRTPTPRFAIERTGALNDGGDVRFLLPHAHVSASFLCGILNSSAVNVWLHWRGKRKGPLFELFKEPLAAIPVPDPAHVDAELIAALALALEATPEDASIRAALDDAVARAYGLSRDEGGLLRTAREAV